MIRIAVIAATLLAIGGCSYESQYVAPKDGRTRAVWKQNHIEVDTGGVPLGPLCLAQIAWETNSETMLFTDGERTSAIPLRSPWAWRAPGAFWVPIWWGLPPPAPVGGIAPPLPAPPIFVAPPIARRLSLAPIALPPMRGGGVGGAPGVRIGGGGSGGGGDAGKVLAYLAIVALVVMPIVDVALAAAPAESVSASVRGIDQANALIDLSRMPGSPCAPYGEVPQ